MIATKQQMYRELKRGRLGNCLRNWTGMGALLESGFTGLVGARHTTVSGHKMASLPGCRPRELTQRLQDHGVSWNDVIIQEGAPDERLVLQGEAMRSADGLVLRISYRKVMMRVAMENAIHIYGIRATTLLREVLTPSSYDDLMDLLDEYDNGPTGVSTVVEFGVYEMPLGHAKNRNIVIWECRSY